MVSHINRSRWWRWACDGVRCYRISTLILWYVLWSERRNATCLRLERDACAFVMRDTHALFKLRCSPCIICISTWHWLFCDPAGASNQTDDTHPRPLLLTLDSSLQLELQVELRDLAEQHPGLSVLTISKRRSWAVYATHSDISKSLQRPFRKVEHIVPTVRKFAKSRTNQV